MNLLDRYIFKGVLFTCLGAIGLFAFVLMLGNIVRDLMGPVASGQISLATAGELVLLLAPFALSYALPMGILTGILLVLGRLSADSEITAMRANGLGILSISRPVFILALLGVAAGLYVNFESMPWARTVYHERWQEAVQADPLRIIVEKTWIRSFKGIALYVDSKVGPDLGNLYFRQIDAQGREILLVRADSAHIEYDRAANDLILTTKGAQVTNFDPKDPEDFSGMYPLIASFASSEPVRLSLDQALPRATKRQKLQWMTAAELQAESERLAEKTAIPGQEKELAKERMKVAMTVQDKINTALAALSFALMGVPLGIKVSRRETSASLGVATMLALGYYFLTVMVGWVDEHPEYRPDLLLWVPNLIFSTIGLVLFRRIEKR